MNNPHICFLGYTKSIQKDNIERVFNNCNTPIHFMNLWRNQSAPKAEKIRFSQRLALYNAKFTGINSPAYTKELESFLDKNGINCILAYWGLNVFADIITIKKVRPKIKIVLNVLCHPMGQTPGKIFIQNKYFKCFLKYLDGIIYSSSTMSMYFKQHVIGKLDIPGLIQSPYLSKDYFCRVTAESYPDNPSLLYLGRRDWWNGDASDNLESFINDLMKMKIRVCYCSKETSDSNNKYACIFEPMPLIDLKSFGNKCYAALVCYNLTNCKDDTRFRMTIPDRLMASIAMGLPIAIPKKGYDAAKEFLRNWPGVIEFDSISDLYERLLDSKHINELNISCLRESPKFYAESHFNYLLSFLTGLNLKNE
jgi:hypothetical protein